MDKAAEIEHRLDGQNGLTVSQISKLSKNNSRPLTLYYLKKLVNEGRVVKEGFKYFLNKKGSLSAEIPFYGKIRAGHSDCFAASEQPEKSILVPFTMINDNPDMLFSFEVVGDSMKPTLDDGALVLCKRVKKGDAIKDKSIVVARVSDGLKLKRYVSLNNSILLLSDNLDYKPIQFDEVKDEIIAIYRRRIK
ncbi:MAG: S24 family peptidase [Methylacidiphilales bacterium]|nr:S24 family peptidase [Candidatus Methylacidiphilales bacterium]